MSSRFLFSLLGCAALATPGLFADDYRLSGPYTHENLSIFLIHGAPSKAGAKYMTLQEAMEQKLKIIPGFLASRFIFKSSRRCRLFPNRDHEPAERLRFFLSR